MSDTPTIELAPITVTAEAPAEAERVRGADLVLLDNGRVYAGWQTVRVSRGIDRVAADFHLGLSDRWHGGADGWQIKEFSAIELRLGGLPIITGYVDAPDSEIDERALNISVAGRSKTEDLIDCNPELAGVEFRGTTLAAIARALCAPFGIEVLVQVDTGQGFDLTTTDRGLADAFDAVVLERTETCFEFIEKLARLRGVLCTDDERGRLVLTRAGASHAGTVLELGRNLLNLKFGRNVSKRFSKYTVLAQHGDAGEESLLPLDGGAASVGGGSAVVVQGSATDQGVPRYRPKVQSAEKALTAAAAYDRARWQAAWQYGRSVQVSALVRGWTQPDLTLWKVNQQVTVKAPRFGLAADFLVVALDFTLDEKGRTTMLHLGPIEGYTPDPGQVKRRTPSGGGAESLLSLPPAG